MVFILKCNKTASTVYLSVLVDSITNAPFQRKLHWFYDLISHIHLVLNVLNLSSKLSTTPQCWDSSSHPYFLETALKPCVLRVLDSCNTDPTNIIGQYSSGTQCLFELEHCSIAVIRVPIIVFFGWLSSQNMYCIACIRCRQCLLNCPVNNSSIHLHFERTTYIIISTVYDDHLCWRRNQTRIKLHV